MSPTTPRRLAPLAALAAAGVGILAIAPAGAKPPDGRVTLEQVGRYAPPVEFDTSAAEVVAFDAGSQRAFVVNAAEGIVDVLDLSDPTDPVEAGSITAGGEVNSVDVHAGLVAVAVQADPVQDPGWVELYDATSLAQIGADISAGALPDMVTFTPDGTTLLVANEGEPDEYCADGLGDPEGSITVVDVTDPWNPTTETAGFGAFDAEADDLRAAGVRIFGPGATVSQDLEPEYITTDADGTTAWVSLQENNAYAIVDIASATVTDVVPLGFKDHAEAGNSLDASNRDDAIDIRNWPVLGMYQPDAIDSYEHGNRTYVVSANEGDGRDYDCYSEESRIGDLEEDEAYVPPLTDEQLEDENLGRLKVTTSFYGDPGPVEELYSFGARSITIRDEAGELVWDSGDLIERTTAELLPDHFNSNNDDNDSFDSRSDDKGPEPEGIVIGRAYGKTYAFVGLERVGGVMVFDITNPRNAHYVSYVNNRVWSEDAEAADGSTNPAAGDLGPEGLEFVPAGDSPNGVPLLIVGNEVSGTTTVYEVRGPGTPR